MHCNLFEKLILDSNIYLKDIRPDLILPAKYFFKDLELILQGFKYNLFNNYFLNIDEDFDNQLYFEFWNGSKKIDISIDNDHIYYIKSDNDYIDDGIIDSFSSLLLICQWMIINGEKQTDLII